LPERSQGQREKAALQLLCLRHELSQLPPDDGQQPYFTDPVPGHPLPPSTGHEQPERED